MIVLGIESSCDETAAAIVKGNDQSVEVLANRIVSQIDIHAQYGGVVPEIASRSHIEAVLPVINEAVKEAFPSLDKAEAWKQIDAIAVTNGPGLSGALLMGTLTARTLAWVHDKPIYGVNHVLGHVYANFIHETQQHAKTKNEWKAPSFPLLAMVVSGGHSQFMLFEDHFDYKLLGKTEDDAVGEAFDKVAKVLGLPYPGGPSIQKAAKAGNPDAYKLPKPRVQNPYGLSYSGLKTATLRLVQGICDVPYDFPSFRLSELLTLQQVNDVAASFQKTALEMLVDRTVKAYEEYSPTSVVIGGGVAASQALRTTLADRLPIDITYASMEYCTDNAAMIASLAYFQSQYQEADDRMTLEINPNMKV